MQPIGDVTDLSAHCVVSSTVRWRLQIDGASAANEWGFIFERA
jgi:hypothetical protein